MPSPAARLGSGERGNQNEPPGHCDDTKDSHRGHKGQTRSPRFLKILRNGMNLEIDRSGQLSYFLRDPLSDLRDLCVNLGHTRESACLPSTKRKANLTEDRKDHKDPTVYEVSEASSLCLLQYQPTGTVLLTPEGKAGRFTYVPGRQSGDAYYTRSDNSRSSSARPAGEPIS